MTASTENRALPERDRSARQQMPAFWTTEQILALSADTSSTKAGRDLASPARWVSLGRTEQAIWGECKGSAREPYQTQVDLSEPAFRCTCPSRKLASGAPVLVRPGRLVKRLVKVNDPVGDGGWMTFSRSQRQSSPTFSV